MARREIFTVSHIFAITFVICKTFICKSLFNSLYIVWGRGLFIFQQALLKRLPIFFFRQNQFEHKQFFLLVGYVIYIKILSL